MQAGSGSFDPALKLLLGLPYVLGDLAFRLRSGRLPMLHSFTAVFGFEKHRDPPYVKNVRKL